MRFEVLILLLFPSICLSQLNHKNSSISGKVTNVKTNESMIGVNVMIKEINKGMPTDESGQFLFNDMENGVFNLSVSFLGYRTINKAITLKNGQHLTINFSLEDTTFQMQGVEITASKMNNKPFQERAERINFIESKAIQSAPIRNLPELLDYMPGANLGNTMGIFSSSTVVTLRGMPSNEQSRTLVILDGVPQNKADQGTVNWNKIDKNNIESIKIIKGPGSAKYGSGAMGGIIEITSKKPEKKLEGSTTVEYGTYNTKSVNANLGGRIYLDSVSSNHLYWRVNTFGRESDGYITELSEFILEEDTFLVPVFLKEFNTFANVGYRFKNNQTISIQTNYYDDKRGNGIKVFEDLGAYSTHRTENIIGSYTGKTQCFEWGSYVFFTSENFIKQYESMFEGEYRLYEANVIRKDLGAKADLKMSYFNNHEIETGVAFNRGSVDGSDIYFTSSDKITNKGTIDNYAIYIQDAYYLLEKRLQINFGLRYDITSFYNNFFEIDDPSYSMVFYKNFNIASMPAVSWSAISPKFSSQYHFNTKNRIYLSAAKGFRSPILDDLTRNGKKRGTFKIANPYITPEYLTSFEVGGDVELSEKIVIETSVFYSIGKDFMYVISTGDSVNMGYRKAPLLTTKNISKVEIYGSELEIKYKLNERISFFANLSYTHAQIKNHQVNNPKVDSSLTNKYLTDVPDFKVGCGTTWKNKLMNVNVLYKYSGKSWVNDMNLIDKEVVKSDKFSDYGIVSLKLDKTIKEHINISLSLENLFDKIYFTSNAQRSPGRLVTGALKVYF